jgi:hypothetical protein
MSNTDADTAISALDKLIDQELAAVRAASSHLTIWTELPGWAVWLLRHKTWKTMHNQQRKESK